MADLAATDVTVTIPSRHRDIVPATGVKVVLAQVAFGDGSLTYKTNGVPLPTKGYFGFLKGINAVFVQGKAGDDCVYKYDPDNHSIRIIDIGDAAELTGGTTAVDATTLQLLMIGQ